MILVKDNSVLIYTNSITSIIKFLIGFVLTILSVLEELLSVIMLVLF